MYNNNLIIETMYQKHMTIKELCELSGLSHETIGRMKKGENVSVASLHQVANALNIPISDLFAKAQAA